MSRDEIIGLNRAFIYAGTPSVIASLWTVEDQATELLMKQFYQNLQDGMDKAKALQQAQIKVRENAHHPHYWAGFVLTGDGEKIHR
jgi:CHAT domain-containing protein